MISFSQTQDGYMEKVAGALERMSELAMLATDETKSNNDRDLYQKEYEELQDYIANVGDKTFNGTSLFSSDTLSVAVGNSLNGSAVKIGLTGANLKSDADYINVYSTSTAAVTGNVITEIGTASLAAYTLGKVQSAISQLGYDRAQVGANISRLETERNTISILRDNLSAAKSRILDVDVAEESANFARQQILVQSGTAMLAQANVLPQAALALIG
jgi:flagellin